MKTLEKIDAFFRSDTVRTTIAGLGIVAIVGVWWEKMSWLMLNSTLSLGVLALTLCVLCLPWVVARGTMQRFLCTGLALIAFAVPAYFFLWTPPTKLDLGAQVGRTTASPTIGGITWQPEYLELHVIIANNSDSKIEDIDIVAGAGLSVAACGLVKGPGPTHVLFQDEPNFSMRVDDGTNKTMMPPVFAASERGVRIYAIHFPEGFTSMSF